MWLLIRFNHIGNDSDLQMAGKARKLMRRIGMWASTYKCAVVLIGHFSKNEGAKDLYRGLGSIDVVAAARSVLQVERSSEDEDVRIVRQVKNSLESKGADLLFEIRPTTGFRWIGTSERPGIVFFKMIFICFFGYCYHFNSGLLKEGNHFSQIRMSAYRYFM